MGTLRSWYRREWQRSRRVPLRPARWESTTVDIVELKALVKGRMIGDELSLAASDLGSATITELSESYLPNGHIVIRDVSDIVEPAGADSITVIGTGNAVPFPNMHVEAEFTVRGGEAAVLVTATGGEGWAFDASFPPLFDTVFSRLAFDQSLAAPPSPCLYLASYAVSDKVGRGMSFSGMLQPSSALREFGFLLGSDSQLLSGPITIQNAIPVMTLGGPASSAVRLGFFDLPAVALEVCSTPVYNSVEDRRKAETFLRLSTAIDFAAGGRPYSLPLSALLHDHQTVLLFTAGLTEVVGATINELSALLDGFGLDGVLPSEHFSVLDLITLSDLVVQVDPAATNKISFVTVAAQTAKSWPLVEDPNLGKELSIDSVKLLFRLDDPGGTRRLSLAVLGQMTIGQDGELEFNALSDLTFAGGLKEGKTLKLKDLYEAFGGRAGTDMPDVEVRELDFMIRAETGDYSVNALVDGSVSVGISSFQYGIDELSLSVDHTSGGSTHLQLLGGFTFAGMRLTVTLTYDSDGGLQFEGQTDEGEEVDFTDLITRLFDLWGFELPQNLPEISLKNLYVSYNARTKAFACKGQNTIASALQIGGTVHEVDTNLDLSVVTDDAIGRETFAGFLRGQLTLGSAVFQLEWDFGAAEIVKGVWDGTGGGPLGFDDLAASHGIDHDLEPPGGTDLALSRAAFEFDLTRSRFLLSADSAEFGDAFFIASNANQAWDFAFGVVMLLDQVFPDFPSLGPLRLEESSLILSTVRDDKFTVPSLPGVPPPPGVTPPAAAPRRTFPALGANPMPLSPGVSVAALLDLEKSADGSVILANAKQAVSQPKLLVQAVIADPIGQSSLRAYLSGALTLGGSGETKLVLSNAYVQFQLDPLGVLVSGSVLVPMDAVTLEASGALVVTAEQMQAIFDVKAESDGQAAALPFPFGLLGVRLDELAVAVGMIFEPPGVDLALEGRFNIVGTPVGSDQFIVVLELEEEVPNPLYLSVYMSSLSVSDLITAVTGETVDLPDVIRATRADDLTVYWSETPGIVLPDRTVTQAGFGFNGNITVGTFRAHARLQVSSVSGVSGDAEMSPIDWHGVLSVMGDGAGVTLLQENVDGQWRTVRKSQGLTGGAPPAETREYQVIPPGGPTLAFNTRRSPFIDVSMQVSLFNLANLDVEVVIAKEGFTFKLDGNIGSAVKFQFDCTLDKSGFGAHAELDLDIAGDIGPVVIVGLDLGTISLDVSLAAVVDVTVDASGFTLAVAGKFWFDDHHLELPKLPLHEDFHTLEELPGKVLGQIRAFSEQVFEDLFNEARQLLQDAEAEAKQITDAIAGEISQIAGDAEQEAQRIVDAAQQAYQGVAAGIADAEAEAQALEREATQLLVDAAAEVTAIAEAAEQEARKIEAAAQKFLDDAAAEVAEMERVVAQEVADLEAQATQLLDDATAEAGRIAVAVEEQANSVIAEARRVADAIVADARVLAQQMEDEAEKILGAIAAAAESAVHWVEKTADDAWHAIKKY